MNRNVRFLSLAWVVGTVIVASAIACGGKAPVPSEDVAGRKLFRGNCAMCHGPTGDGMPGLGKSMRANAFVQGLSDEELVRFLAVGRPARHPLNERGIAMPPRGGNPTLSDQDLALIAAYIRSIQ